MYFKSPILLTTIFLISCTINNNIKTKNGFDSACIIYQKASTKKLPPQELGNYIENELNKLEHQEALSDVKQVYQAIFNVSPDERYALFKESAEITLKRKWDCSVMRKMYEYNTTAK